MSDRTQQFAPGTRVRLTEEALEQFPRHRGWLGTVVAMSRDPLFARIQMDGYKSATHWAVSYFEVAHETAPSDGVTTGTDGVIGTSERE